MASSCSSKRIGVAIALCVLLLLLILCSFYSLNPLTSILLTLLLVLSTSLIPFFLPSIRQQLNLDSAGLPKDDQVFLDEKAATSQVVTENSSQTPSHQCLKLDDDEDSSAHEDAYDSIETYSEGSISDDENLIEISLPDGHFVAPEEPKAMLKPLLPADIRRGVLMKNFLPESVVRQHGLMELLSEINEEDNLIEIDIARGSIKCSRVGILA